jgi:non-heme chloroperoxidase
VPRSAPCAAIPSSSAPAAWLLDSSWNRGPAFFEDAGYATVTPGWPDDPDTVAEAREHPDVGAHKGVGDVA